MSSRWCGRWASLRGTSWSCRRRQAPERTSSGSGASQNCEEGGVPSTVGTGSKEKNTFYERKFLYCNTRLRLIIGWNRLVFMLKELKKNTILSHLRIRIRLKPFHKVILCSDKIVVVRTWVDLYFQKFFWFHPHLL